MLFCGAPNNHAPLQKIMWRIQARAPLNNGISMAHQLSMRHRI
jgi:hypothetical protein